MTRKFSRKMIMAVERTIQAYERLIEDPDKEFDKWSAYGDCEHCRCCRVVGYTSSLDKEPCNRCLLSRDENTRCFNSDGERTWLDMISLTESWYRPSNEKIRKNARARLKWIIKTINKNGYEYK